MSVAEAYYEMTTPRQAILELLIARGPDKSICPSEAARRLSPSNWRVHLDEIRAAGVELEREGKLTATQKGEPVSLSAARGPVRFTMAPSS